MSLLMSFKKYKEVREDEGEYWNKIYNSGKADPDETLRVLRVKVGLKVENRDSGLKVI